MNPGIYQGISNADYHGGAGVSKSQLDKLARSPAHYHHSTWAAQEPTEAMKIGTATHTAILEPELFDAEIAIAPQVDRRTKAGKAEWAEFCAASEGKTIIKPEDHHAIACMRDAVMSHPAANELLTGGIAEQSAYWIDEETGLLCRCRPDYHRGPFLVDLKTTDDASPRAFARSVAKFRYHVQDPFYTDGFNAAGGDVDEFVFVAVEKSPPYAVAVYYLDDDGIQRGRDAYRENLATMKRCMESERWQAFSDEPQLLEVPQWA